MGPMSAREREPHSEFPITYTLIDKLTGTAEEILEKRYPGQSLNRQMLKSPDVMLAGAIASGVVSLIGTAEIPVEIGKAVARRVRGKGQSST